MSLNNFLSSIYRIALIFFLLSTSCAGTTPAETLQPGIRIPEQADRVDNKLFFPFVSGPFFIRIPEQADWVDYGTIFEAGAPGEWDHYLWGGFAFSAIKKDDTYFLYYQGASDYRTEYDETVLWRAIGVATSQDGVHFSKYEGNPILTWFPNQSGEEGAVSSGVTIGDEGEVFFYYGANTEENATTINADIRVASSTDGLRFNDLGEALNHKDQSVWGSGDELFPITAIHDQGKWIVYYIPNGTLQSGKLGVAHGSRYDALETTSAVRSENNLISVWGTAGHVKIDQLTYALILNNVRENWTQVRLTSLQTPNEVSAPLISYQFEDIQQTTLLLDEEKKSWFLYYRARDRYGVMVAPMDETNIKSP